MRRKRNKKWPKRKWAPAKRNTDSIPVTHREKRRERETADSVGGSDRIASTGILTGFAYFLNAAICRADSVNRFQVNRLQIYGVCGVCRIFCRFRLRLSLPLSHPQMQAHNGRIDTLSIIILMAWTSPKPKANKLNTSNCAHYSTEKKFSPEKEMTKTPVIIILMPIYYFLLLF